MSSEEILHYDHSGNGNHLYKKDVSLPDTVDRTEFNKEWWERFRQDEVDEILRLTSLKNSDYTGGDTQDNPFENFDGSTDFGIEPLVGVALRMQDKFQRLKAFSRDGKLSLDEKGDTTRDIFRDLIGYSLIAIGMLERDNK